MARKPPRWVVPFLRALERTGKVRSAAEDAGVDHSTAYVRRRTHAEFAAGWAEALAKHKAGKKREEEERMEDLRANGLPLSPTPPPLKGGGASGGEELIISGNQLKRASGERWGPRKQEAFLAELTMTGILRRACDAVRISRQAVDRRRRNDPHFDASCRAAIAAFRARIPELLAGATAATFDPDALFEDGPNPLPKVTVAEAIKIAQMGGASAAEPPPDIEAVRERLERAMRALSLIDDEEPQPADLTALILSADDEAEPERARTCPHCRQTVYLAFDHGGGAPTTLSPRKSRP